MLRDNLNLSLVHFGITNQDVQNTVVTAIETAGFSLDIELADFFSEAHKTVFINLVRSAQENGKLTDCNAEDLWHNIQIQAESHLNGAMADIFGIIVTCCNNDTAPITHSQGADALDSIAEQLEPAAAPLPVDFSGAVAGLFTTLSDAIANGAADGLEAAAAPEVTTTGDLPEVTE